MSNKITKAVAILAAATALSLTACGSNADQEELERLRKENEELKAQVETTLPETTLSETTSVTTETTTTVVTEETTSVTEPEYIDHEFVNKEYPSKSEVICRVVVDKNSTEEDILELFNGEINNTANENMTVWFYSDKSMTDGEYDVAKITREGKYGKPVISMVDKQKGDNLRNAAESDSIIVTDAPPKWSYYEDCAVSIEGATLVTDYKGNDAIAVEIKFRNDSSKDHSYVFTFVTKAFQNGIECEDAILTGSYGEQFDTGTSIIDIKPGAELTVYQTFKLRDDSDVVVEISGLYDIDSEVIARCTFK